LAPLFVCTMIRSQLYFVALQQRLQLLGTTNRIPSAQARGTAVGRYYDSLTTCSQHSSACGAASATSSPRYDDSHAIGTMLRPLSVRTQLGLWRGSGAFSPSVRWLAHHRPTPAAMRSVDTLIRQLSVLVQLYLRRHSQLQQYIDTTVCAPSAQESVCRLDDSLAPARTQLDLWRCNQRLQLRGRFVGTARLMR
jgi:hypothetical protein